MVSAFELQCNQGAIAGDYWRSFIEKDKLAQIIDCGQPKDGQVLFRDARLAWVAPTWTLAGCAQKRDWIISEAGRVNYVPCEAFGSFEFDIVGSLRDAYFSVLLDDALLFSHNSNSGSIDKLLVELGENDAIVKATRVGNTVKVFLCKSTCGQSVTLGDESSAGLIEILCEGVSCCCSDFYLLDVCMPQVDGCFGLVLIDPKNIDLLTTQPRILAVLGGFDIKQKAGNEFATMAYWRDADSIFEWAGGNILYKERLPIFIKKGMRMMERSERTLFNLNKANDKVYLKDQYDFLSRPMSLAHVEHLQEILLHQNVWIDTPQGVRRVYLDKFDYTADTPERGTVSGRFLVQDELKTNVSCEIGCEGNQYGSLTIRNRNDVAVWAFIESEYEGQDEFYDLQSGMVLLPERHCFYARNNDRIDVSVGVWVDGVLVCEKTIKPNCKALLCSVVCRCAKVEIMTASMPC